MINIIIALGASKGRDKLSLAVAGGGIYNMLPPVVSGSDIMKTVYRCGGRGVIICPEKLPDMYYTELSEILPDSYKILLIKKSGGNFYEKNGNMAMLIIPFSAFDLLATIKALSLDLMPMKPKNKGSRAKVEEAKAILMAKNNMTEPQAHRFIQKRSMDTRVDVDAVAEEIIKLFK
jgi:response regulator NasT